MKLTYEIIKESGPCHNRIFEVKCSLNDLKTNELIQVPNKKLIEIIEQDNVVFHTEEKNRMLKNTNTNLRENTKFTGKSTRVQSIVFRNYETIKVYKIDSRHQCYRIHFHNLRDV